MKVSVFTVNYKNQSLHSVLDVFKLKFLQSHYCHPSYQYLHCYFILNLLLLIFLKFRNTVRTDEQKLQRGTLLAHFIQGLPN